MISESISERIRIQDEDQYGKPSDRNRGRVQVTPQLFYGFVHLPLPRMTRIVGVEPNKSYFDIIVESPDIEPSTETGTLPVLSMTTTLNSMPKEVAAPNLAMVEYAAISAWEGKPDTRAATMMFGHMTGGSSRSQEKLLASIERDNAGKQGNAVGILNEINAYLTANPPDMTSWETAVTSLPSDLAYRALGVMMDSFWGWSKPSDIA